AAGHVLPFLGIAVRQVGHAEPLEDVQRLAAVPGVVVDDVDDRCAVGLREVVVVAEGLVQSSVGDQLAGRLFEARVAALVPLDQDADRAAIAVAVDRLAAHLGGPGADVEDHVVEGGPQRAVPDVELLVELLVAQAPAQLQDPSRRPAVVSQESVEQIHRRSSASLRCRMYGSAPACYVAGLELIVVRTSNVCSETEYGRCWHLTSGHAGSPIEYLRLDRTTSGCWRKLPS